MAPDGTRGWALPPPQPCQHMEVPPCSRVRCEPTPHGKPARLRRPHGAAALFPRFICAGPAGAAHCPLYSAVRDPLLYSSVRDPFRVTGSSTTDLPLHPSQQPSWGGFLPPLMALTLTSADGQSYPYTPSMQGAAAVPPMQLRSSDGNHKPKLSSRAAGGDVPSTRIPANHPMGITAPGSRSKPPDREVRGRLAAVGGPLSPMHHCLAPPWQL